MHDLIGREMVDNVPDARQPHEIAAGQLLMKAPRLAFLVGYLIFRARDDDGGQLQVAMALLELRSGRGYERCVFRCRPAAAADARSGDRETGSVFCE